VVTGSIPGNGMGGETPWLPPEPCAQRALLPINAANKAKKLRVLILISFVRWALEHRKKLSLELKNRITVTRFRSYEVDETRFEFVDQTLGFKDFFFANRDRSAKKRMLFDRGFPKSDFSLIEKLLDVSLSALGRHARLCVDNSSRVRETPSNRITR